MNLVPKLNLGTPLTEKLSFSLVLVPGGQAWEVQLPAPVRSQVQLGNESEIPLVKDVLLLPCISFLHDIDAAGISRLFMAYWVVQFEEDSGVEA